MKRLLLFTIGVTLLLSCSYDETVDTNMLTVELKFPTSSNEAEAMGGIRIELKSISNNAIFVDSTDTQGKAHFEVTPGVYEASTSVTRQHGNSLLVLNGTSGQIVIDKTKQNTVFIDLMESRISQVVIKELYNGGVMKDDGKLFMYDKCFILYNNSNTTASLENLCVGIASPYNSQANNNWYGADGKLIYESDGYTPATDGIWYFQETLHIAPYSQIVVNVHGAINNAQTYPQSVNYANADYYCMYDPEHGYTNTNYYPTPSEVIPTSHYLKAIKIGTSNAWALSTSSPALYIFQTHDALPRDFATNVGNTGYTPGASQTDAFKVVKVPTEWITDGLEVFSATSTGNKKRLTSMVDAGYVNLTNQHGHSLYRNVDKKATESLPENKGKLVYGYVSDPSGIDAEASIRNGAHIVYQDTNNSSNDFHERLSCSLKD